MKFAADFEAFLRAEVNLNQSRLDSLQQRVGAIEDFICANEEFSDAFVDLIPAGSWAHRTIIKPVSENDEFDADVLLLMDEQENWSPKDYIEKLYSAFRSSPTYKPLAGRKTRCVRVDYSGDFHVDVVPYLERSSSHYITNRLEPADYGSFELTDPEAFTAWIDERQRMTGGNFVKTVRLVKYLRDFKNTFVCKSIILTTLLGNEVSEIEATYYPERFADVPSTLVTLLENLAGSLPESMPAVMDPAGTGENFTDRYRSDWDYSNFRKMIISYADKVRQAYDETDRSVATSLWRDVFGDGFKPGQLAEVARVAPLSASVPWEKEQFIDKPPFNFPIALDHAYKVRVSARCTGLNTGQMRRRHGFRQFELSKGGNRVPKDRSLLFRAFHNVPHPCAIYWKVRNGGPEASRSNALRGEITKDGGNNQKTETTLYSGSHYVECFVVKDGVVVARDHQAVIVT